MIATIHPGNSPFALAHPQAGHAALAAVQVYPRFGDALGMPNRAKSSFKRAKARLSGNEWSLSTIGTGAFGLTAVQASPVRGRSLTHGGTAGQGIGQQCISTCLVLPAPQVGPVAPAMPGSRFGDSILVQEGTSGTLIGTFSEKEGGM
jgi:hypothetical protein